MSWISAHEYDDSLPPTNKLPCVTVWCQDAQSERQEEDVVSYDLADASCMMFEEWQLDLPGAPSTLTIGSKRYARTNRLHRADDIVSVDSVCDDISSASEVHAYKLVAEAPDRSFSVPAANRWSGESVVDHPELPLPGIELDRISLMRPYDRLALKFTACFFSKYDASNRLHRACHASVVRSIHKSVHNARAIDLCSESGNRCDKTFTPIRVPRIRPGVPFQTVNILRKPDKDDPALEERYLFCAAVMPHYDMTLREYIRSYLLIADDTLHLVIAIVELVACVRELGHTYMDLKTSNVGVWCDRRGDLTLTLIDLDDMDQGACTFPHFSVLSEDAGNTPITDQNFMWTLAACICETITRGRVKEKYGEVCSDMLEKFTTESSAFFTGETRLVENLRRQAEMLREALHSSSPKRKRFKPSFPAPVA
eukprot:gene325-592_t